jgi:hypothetical protein
MFSWLDAQTSNIYTLTCTLTSHYGAIFQLSTFHGANIIRMHMDVGGDYDHYGVIHIELNQYTEA